MAGMTYGTQAGRLEKYKGRILAKAQTREMLTKLGAMDPMPQNKSETIEWMRFLPYGGVDNEWISAGGDTAFIAKHLIQEGVTPTPDSIAWTTLSTTLQEIGCLYSYSNKLRHVHEEGQEIPREMEDQAATRIALCREMMVYGELKSCTNVFYGGTGTSIATVNGPPTKAMFQNISRALLGKHAMTINKMLKSGPNFGMQSVNASWPVYCHTDMEKTFENIAGFTKVQDYGGAALLDPEYEIGAIGRFRVIVNPILTYRPGAGAVVGSAVGGFTPKSDGTTNIDVYPLVIIGKGNGGGEAFGQVPLRGFDSVDVNHFSPSEKSKIDPLGQRGYVSAMCWQAQSILNDDWMAVAWVGTEA
jgi:N4-gp56 family major capsid protein